MAVTYPPLPSKPIIPMRLLAFLTLFLPMGETATPGPIALYYSETDVDNYLNRDLIQANFEAELSEFCSNPEDTSVSTLDTGKSFWEDPDPNRGGYFRSIPTYGRGPDESISDEWNEYLKHFGKDDFHIEWVTAAFERRSTQGLKRFGANFPKAFGPLGEEGGDLGPTPNYDEDPPPPDGPCVGYEQSIKKATAFLFNFIEAMQLLQKAIDLVDAGCEYDYGLGCKDALRAWDASVAIYVGSLEGSLGNNCATGCYGKSIYGLADKRCDEYYSCGTDLDRQRTSKELTSAINVIVLNHYSVGQMATKFGHTDEMRKQKRILSAKMIVPLIQGTFRYTWRMSLEGVPRVYPESSTTDKEVSEGATFALGAIPKLWACSQNGARLATREIKIGGTKAGAEAINYQNVRLAFECNYKCLGISCAEIGTLLDGDSIPRWFACEDKMNGSGLEKVARCDRPSLLRAKQCRRYTGKPGIPGRDHPEYFAVGLLEKLVVARQ